MSYADLKSTANRLTAFTRRVRDRIAGGKETKREFLARAHLRAWQASHEAWIAHRKAAESAKKEDVGKNVVERHHGMVTIHTRHMLEHEATLATLMGQTAAVKRTSGSAAAKKSGWSGWKQKNPGWRSRYGGK